MSKIIQVEVTDEQHEAITYIVAVLGGTQKAQAANTLQRGLTALALDPTWAVKVQAYEDKRRTALAGLGLGIAPAPAPAAPTNVGPGFFTKTVPPPEAS